MFDLKGLSRFLSKDYRDEYLSTHIRSSIAYQIQAIRRKFSLTQREFSQKTGKKQSTVSRLENTEYGKVTVQTLLDIACALDVALVVRFVDYPTFLGTTRRMSEIDLQPKTIFESATPMPSVPLINSFYSNSNEQAQIANTEPLKIGHSPYNYIDFLLPVRDIQSSRDLSVSSVRNQIALLPRSYISSGSSEYELARVSSALRPYEVNGNVG